MKGLFITFEGPDGCGKSTISKKVYKQLCEEGYSVICTREPGGTPIGEKIRDIILDKENSLLCAETEALLYAASRAQHVDEKILPALKQGKIVLCDRFVMSSLAYQGYGRGLGIEAVENINNFATKNLKPNITFLFDIDPLITLKRKLLGEADRLELAGCDFHKKVYEGYGILEEMYGDRINIIDASKDIEEVFQSCLTVIRNKMEEYL